MFQPPHPKPAPEQMPPMPAPQPAFENSANLDFLSPKALEILRSRGIDQYGVQQQACP